MKFRSAWQPCLRVCLLLLLTLPGCGRTPEPLAEPTPQAVLDQIRALGGSYKLNAQQQVTVLSFHRCPLQDGDLEILRSTPEVWTLNLRGVSVVGGTLSEAGLEPLASLSKLQRLDLSSNYHLTGSLDALRPLSRLSFLNLVGTPYEDEAMETVGKLPALNTLLLGHNGITEAGIRALHGSPLERLDHCFHPQDDVGSLGGLKRLKNWRSHYGHLPASRLVALEGMEQLQSLWIQCKPGESTPEAIRALRSLKSLEVLQITTPNDVECPLLLALDSLPRLKTLRLVGIGDLGLQPLPPLPGLENLDLSVNTHVTADSLGVLERLPALRQLALRPQHTTQAELEIVSRCARLETLAFESGRFDQADRWLPTYFIEREGFVPMFTAEDLRPVLQNAPLRTLHLDQLGLGDEVMPVVALAHQLETLNLTQLPISDAGIIHLRRLEHLKWVGLAGTQVGIVVAEQLQREHLPRCHFTDNWCCGCMELPPLEPE